MLVCHGYSHRVASHLCPLFAQGAFAQVLLAGCQDEVLQLTHLARSCACLATNTNTVRTYTHTHTRRENGAGDDDDDDEWPLEDNFDGAKFTLTPRPPLAL